MPAPFCGEDERTPHRLSDPNPTLHLESILERPRFRLRGWMLQGYILPAARFELARVYAQTGDADSARAHYRAFLDLFTDPDPDFAWMVEEAKRATDR